MQAKTRRKIEMGIRALAFCVDHPDPSEGYGKVVASLQSLITRARQLMTLQSESLRQLRGATARRVELRKRMRRTHMSHVARVARLAAAEDPNLEQTFKLVREDVPYLEFLSVARHFAAEAIARRDLLVHYGLADTMLTALQHSVEEFDGLNHSILEAHLQHVRATAELRLIGGRIIRLVGVIDALNRFRFDANPELMAAWLSSSNVVNPRRGPEELRAAS